MLKVPLLTLAQAGKSDVNFRDNTSNDWAEPYLHRVDDAIEPTFFNHLFARGEVKPEGRTGPGSRSTAQDRGRWYLSRTRSQPPCRWRVSGG